MLETKCRQAVKRFGMISQGDSVIVGLSGGADSCALLHYLCSLRDEYSLSITAIHVNHMIRGEEAERDAEYAEKFCGKLGVECILYKRDVPAIAGQKGIGIEQCGREIRYRIFEEEALNRGGKIATAHTLSDSVETVLFHMLRGCAVNGLRGIPPVRGKIIRPLIYCERSDVEEYCARHGIYFVTDSTNFSTDYTRNKIRLQLLPLMREINPSVSEAISRLSESARYDDDFISEYAENAANEYLFSDNADLLFALEPSVVSRALIKICSGRLGITPEQKHIAAMLDSLSRGVGSVNLPGDYIFRVYNNGVFFVKKNDNSINHSDDSNWSAGFEQGEIITPCGQKIISHIFEKNKFIRLYIDQKRKKNDGNIFKNCLDYDKINKAVFFRFRREGDRFSPAGRNCSKSLKKLFNEEKLPPEIRERIPMLVSDGIIAWICGIGAAEQFRVTGNTEKLLYIDADIQDIIYQGGYFQ